MSQCCEAMQKIIDHPVRDKRGIKWQTMYEYDTGKTFLSLVYHCGGGYWKSPVIRINMCPFCGKKPEIMEKK